MDTSDTYSTAELHAALFANLVMQQGNMALMFLGKIPNPESGQTVHELEAARMFVDQLEMLETKTKGNLSPEEAALLSHTLMTVRMAFVEESRNAPQSAELAQETPTPTEPAQESNEDKKRFVKKY
jgi:hypothetical protein